MEYCGITDRGKVRGQNQDVFKTLYNEERGLLILLVCDGMGGAKAGNIASESAAEVFVDFMWDHISPETGSPDIKSAMSDAVHAANSAVYEQSLRDPACTGMGTTLVAAASGPDGEVVVNIGDSRAYHIANGKIGQVTKDHSVVEDMIDRGDITRGAAKNHPNKNLITKALGTPRDEAPDVFGLKLSPGEFLLLCSDGLSNIVADEEILEEVIYGSTVEESCERLMSLALLRGAPDNVTIVLFKK